MFVYSCEPDLTSILTCVYEAWCSKRGHKNIKLLIEPVEQYTLFDEYIHVDPDEKKASSVRDAVCRKISYGFYQKLIRTYLAYEEDAIDNLFHCMILGFAYGERTLDMVQFADVMRHQEIEVRLGKEINRFQEFIRFHQVGEAYIAHFEPKSRIAVALGPIFEDRMPSEHWMIIDDVHKEAVVHPKDEAFYTLSLTDEELDRLKETEQVNDDFTELWKTFFRAVAIKERRNPRCQNNLFPIWTRKHVVEFD